MDDKKRKISFPHGANGKKNFPANTPSKPEGLMTEISSAYA